ncbi:MAG: VOC family protein [Burkholderiales bacterium]|nr:VOC family protein [Burkholderiales bacterium]
MNQTAAAPPALSNFHHVAFRCRDAEETRRFYEGVLGLPLSIALDLAEISGTDTRLEYMHLFFRLEDGNFIAFFDAPDSVRPEHFRKQSGFNRHLAFETRAADGLERYMERLRAHGVEFWGPLDHGFVTSIYFYDPNGINLEITCRTAGYDAILAEEALRKDAALAAWTERTRGRKAERLADATPQA